VLEERADSTADETAAASATVNAPSGAFLREIFMLTIPCHATPEVHAEVVKCAAAVDLAPTTLAAVLVERAVKGEYDRIRRRQRRAAAAAGADE